MNETTDRRKFLTKAASSLGLAIATIPASKAIAEVCGLTPAQTSGPFYPGESQFKHDNDLTQILGRGQRALGKIVYVKGRVVDSNCEPIPDVNVEIWQACESGKYNNPRDPNPAPIDPNFKYWGEDYTNAKGEYIFKTIIPGAYPAAADWVRPPHIHFRISKLGFRELVTQMYFFGDALNEKDAILLQTPVADREKLVVKFQPAGPEFEPFSQLGVFDLTLAKVR